MTPRQGLFERLDDRLNPVVVKELRQAVQSKLVVAALMLFLLVQLAAIGIFLMVRDAEGMVNLMRDFRAGREVFEILLSILLTTSVLCIPLYTGVRHALERSDINVDLLYITTLRPRAIIAGKFMCGLILAILVFSACTPFMTFTYLLRGIDLFSVFLLLALDFLIVAVGIMVAIFLASIPAAPIWRAVLGLLALGGFGWGLAGVILMSNAMLDSGLTGYMDRWEFWAIVASIFVLGVNAIALLFVLSVAMITAPSANRALPVRICLVATWLVTGTIAATYSYQISHHGPALIWVAGIIGLFCLAFFFGAGERDRLGPRILRTIPRPGLLRPLAFLFYSGAAGALTLGLLMISLTLMAGRQWADSFSMWLGASDLFKTIEVMTMISFYAVAYVLTAVLITRYVGGRVLKVGHTWGIAMLLLGLMSSLPLFAAFLSTPTDERQYKWEPPLVATAWNPVWAVYVVVEPSYSGGEPRTYFRFVGCWAGLMAILCVPWYARHVMNFRPLRGPSSPTGNNGQPVGLADVATSPARIRAEEAVQPVPEASS